MKSTNCILVPTIISPSTGEEVASKLYKNLLHHPSLKNKRQIVNYIYAQYLYDGGTGMDNAGFIEKDENGQHSIKDVLTFYKVGEFIKEQANTKGLKDSEKIAGSRDSEGNLIKYDNGKEAIDKALSFNTNNEHRVASVFKDGDKYTIIVENLNSTTQVKKGKTEEQAKLFQTIKEGFNNVGLDFEFLAKEFPNLFDVTNINSTLNYLQAFQRTDSKLLSKQEIKFCLSLLDDSNPLKHRVLAKSWGDLDSIAQKIYDGIKGITSLTAGELSLSLNLIKEAKKFKGLDLEALSEQCANESLGIQLYDSSYSISSILKELYSKFSIDKELEHEASRNIQRLSHAASNAIIILDRKIKRLERLEGVSDNVKDLQKIKDNLLKEIEKSRHYVGLLYFTDVANKDIAAISDKLKNVNGVPGTPDYIANMSSVLLETQNVISAYKDIIASLSNADSYELDGSVTTEQLNKLKTVTEPLLTIINKLENQYKDAQKAVILDILTDRFGDTLPDGRSVVDLLSTITDEVGFIEKIYSASRSSDLLLNTIGGITRNANDKKLQLLVPIATQISRADSKLKKSGIKDTKWMYEEDGHIISQYDWKKLAELAEEHKKALRRNHIKGIEFKLQMQDFYENNTQEIIVDPENGRTERVPIYVKDENPLDNLNQAQLEYYNEMMELKGKLGSLFPEYARHQYLSPQVRSNSLFDAKGWKDFFKRAGDSVKDKFRITESDFDTFGQIALEDSRTIVKTEGNYNDEELKLIPTQYTRKLNDNSKLITDFSGAMQHFAESAINYKTLSDVEASVQLIANYISNQNAALKDDNGNLKADIVSNGKITIFKQLGNFFKKTSTADLVQSYLDRELYGIKLKDNKKLGKLLQTILDYTRFKQLSTNVLGGTSNYLVGEYQMFLEAIGGNNFNLADYTWAHMLLFGDNTIHAPGRILDYLSNNTTELCTLIGNVFDPLQEQARELGHKRYNGIIRNMFSLDWSGATYGIGEYLIHYTGMYAMLHNEKVFNNGKKISLYEAFDASEKENGNKKLRIKDGVRLIEINDRGEEVEGRELKDINDEYILNFRQKIRTVNQECHGAMNPEDRGVLSQRLAGRMVGQFRQWMIEHYSRRYRKLHFDSSSGEWTEGWYQTMYRFLSKQESNIEDFDKKSRLTIVRLNSIINEYQKEVKHRTLSDSAFKSLEQQAKLAQKQKANIKKCMAELIGVTLLQICGGLLISGDKDLKDPAMRFFAYQIKRLAWDALAATPVGFVQEGISMAERPVAALPIVYGALYIPLFGIGDMGKTYKSGRHKGENVYIEKSLRYYAPFYKDYENWEKIIDDKNKDWEDIIIPFDVGRSASR